MLCYCFIFSLSMPFTGVTLAHYFEERHKKGILFSTMVFSLTFLPTLIFLSVIFYNGFADAGAVREIRVKVLDKRIQINKGGGTPLVEFESTYERPGILLDGRREKEVSRELYERIVYGDQMTIYIKPGALGILWIEKIDRIRGS